MPKDLDSITLLPELQEMLDNIERVKSEKYGMILRTVFNLHNVTQGPITLLTRIGIPAETTEQLLKIRKTAIEDAVLTMFKLWYTKEQYEEIRIASENMPDDLEMLLKKQDEYNE